MIEPTEPTRALFHYFPLLIWYVSTFFFLFLFFFGPVRLRTRLTFLLPLALYFLFASLPTSPAWPYLREKRVCVRSLWKDFQTRRLETSPTKAKQGILLVLSPERNLSLATIHRVVSKETGNEIEKVRSSNSIKF